MESREYAAMDEYDLEQMRKDIAALADRLDRVEVGFRHLERMISILGFMALAYILRDDIAALFHKYWH